MSPTTSPSSDAALAASLATEAGALLLELRQTSTLTGKDLGKRGDHDSNELLLHRLAELRPLDAVPSEESVDSPQRLTADRVWIIDPLDGTREYGTPPRPDWAVHIALWERGQQITAAAVAQPSLEATYTTHTPNTAKANTTAGPADNPTLLVSDSRPPTWATEVAHALNATLQSRGSAGAKTIAVVRGDAAAYLHAGGQWEWDSAAPVAIALATGLHASRINGSPLTYNNTHPYLPDLLICRPDLAKPLLAAIRASTP